MVTLELLKQHVRADDFSEDDKYLLHLLKTATQAVIRDTNRTEQELNNMGNGDLPLPIQHAILLLAAHWYNQREAVSQTQMHAVPYTLQSLIKPFTKLTTCEQEQ